MGSSVATIIVTRPEGPDGPLTRFFRDAGQNVLHWQVTAISEASDPAPLRNALKSLGTYDWIVFTSAAAADVVVREHPEPVPAVRVAAVGEATARTLRRAGWSVALVPDQAGAQILAAALLAHPNAPRRVLFPASASGLPTLAQELRRGGVEVDQIEAYRLADVSGPAETWRATLEKSEVDAVTFASPSAVTGLRKVLGDAPFTRIKDLVVTAIGPTTADAARRNGLPVAAVAEPSSLRNLANITLAALSSRSASSKASP